MTSINYTYDPLGRLTAADYSNGDYFHYIYDAMGDRLSQESSVNGLPSTVSYRYDTANRLAQVGNNDYVWDNNGNLLEDGVNQYTYDAANRLIALSNQQSAFSFGYNGLGDRLQQTVDEETTNYTLDLNAGLTQVLDDGAVSYLYGLDRIAQVDGSNADYFLGDALGSVRQLTDDNGTVTLGQSYEPYGSDLGSIGSSSTSYAFTGEMVDATGLIYLRARYYAPQDGRFQTRDAWNGDANQPVSYNLWNYVQSNPVNYTDPTGHYWCSDDTSSRVNFVENNVNLSKTDWLNTYAAAGIGVQCHGTNINKPWDYINSGWGPGQISLNQELKPYGQEVGEDRGYGLRCYISIHAYLTLPAKDLGACTLCKTAKEMREMDPDYQKHYILEPPHNPNDPNWASEYMRRRIKLVTDKCIDANCSSTDIYIAAALAQNGPGFTQQNIHDLTLPKLRSSEDDVTINWKQYFGFPNNADDTSDQLKIFTRVAKKLRNRGWHLPYVNWNTVDELSGIGD